MAKTTGAAGRWRETVGNLQVWKRGNQRAPHKPLLTLVLLARAEANGANDFRFADLEPVLKDLLREYGPPRKALHPEFPFWHLQSDGIWRVRDSRKFPLKKAGHSPTKRSLVEGNASAQVPESLWSALTRSPSLRQELVQQLLAEFWPSTLHEDIRQAVGLPLEGPSLRARRSRDPRFRSEVLRAYEHRCAVCSWDGRLGSTGADLGLEAAHVRWHAHEGEDAVANALALCSLHHVALDRGALGLTETGTILISQDVVGGDRVDEMLLRHGGRKLRAPQRAYVRPAAANVRWHVREVFRAPARA